MSFSIADNWGEKYPTPALVLLMHALLDIANGPPEAVVVIHLRPGEEFEVSTPDAQMGEKLTACIEAFIANPQSIVSQDDDAP